MKSASLVMFNVNMIYSSMKSASKKDSNPQEWNLKYLYNSLTDPRIISDRKKSVSNINRFIKKYRKDKKYLKSSKHLLTALQDFELLTINNGVSDKEGYFLSLLQSLNQSDEKVKSAYNMYVEFANKHGNELEFFTLEISKIDKDTQKKFLKDKKLSNYHHFLKKSFLSAKYLLSEEEEKILNIFSKTSKSNWTAMTSEFLGNETETYIDEKGKKKVGTLTNLLNKLTSKDAKVRDSCAVAINKIIQKHIAVATKELNSILEYKIDVDTLRGLERPDLARHISDDIDSKVVDSLISTVEKTFPLAQRYYKLKAKTLGVKKLKYHDRIAPVGSFDKKFPFNSSKKIVLDVFNGLDSEFGDIVKAFFDEGRIDVKPKKGKRGGAFCTYASPSLPIYIFLNHSNELDSLTTLAHELGHGINDELMKKHVTPLNFGSPLSTAEVASTFFEDFILEEVLKKCDEKERFSILMEKLMDDISSIHRQCSLYIFEKKIHKEFREIGYLSEKRIGEIFKECMSAYMGKYVSQDKGSENWWVYWNHIRYFFYVYSYASGVLISKSLQSMVRKNPKDIVKVKQFLSKGCSQSPSELFLEMGIDISKPTFWKKGIMEIERNLIDAEKLAKKLGII